MHTTPYRTYVKGQHLHRRVEELVLRVLDVPTAEEKPAARQACELLQGQHSSSAASAQQRKARPAPGGPQAAVRLCKIRAFLWEDGEVKHG